MTTAFLESYVLDNTNSADLYRHYFNITLGKSKYNPLRPTEKHPSFSTYVDYNSGIMLWKDFATGKTGNVFDLYRELHKEPVGDFIKDIISRFIDKNTVIVQPYEYTPVSPNTQIPRRKPFEAKAEPNVFNFELRGFKKCDDRYWSKFYITTEDIKLFNVAPVDIVQYKSKVYYQFMLSNICYCYAIKNYNDDSQGYRYKFYQPFENGGFKWIGNTLASDLLGEEAMYSNKVNNKYPVYNDFLILTKSLKDVIVLRKYGFYAVATNSETNRWEVISKAIDRAKNHLGLEKVLIFYDNDEPGIQGAKSASRKSGHPITYIPQHFSQKDISDFIAAYGITETRKLLNHILSESYINQCSDFDPF